MKLKKHRNDCWNWNFYLHLYVAVVSLKNTAILIGILLIGGIGYHIRIPDTLKSVWHRAIWRDFWIDFESALNAASIPVTVVPIFAPRIRGKTLSIVNSPKLTNGTSDDVNTDELCTNIVKPHPN